MKQYLWHLWQMSSPVRERESLLSEESSSKTFLSQYVYWNAVEPCLNLWSELRCQFFPYFILMHPFELSIVLLSLPIEGPFYTLQSSELWMAIHSTETCSLLCLSDDFCFIYAQHLKQVDSESAETFCWLGICGNVFDSLFWSVAIYDIVQILL